MILSTGFDINVRTELGTALHEAAVCGKLDVVRALLANDINLELRDARDRSVIEVMDELKTPVSAEIIHIIIDHMGIVRGRGDKGRRPKSSRPRITPASLDGGSRARVGSTASVASTRSMRVVNNRTSQVSLQSSNLSSMESIDSGSVSIRLPPSSTASVSTINNEPPIK